MGPLSGHPTMSGQNTSTFANQYTRFRQSMNVNDGGSHPSFGHNSGFANMVSNVSNSFQYEGGVSMRSNFASGSTLSNRSSNKAKRKLSARV